MPVLSRARPLLGTLVVIEAEPATGSDGVAQIETAFVAVQRVNDLMHPTDPRSDLSRIAAAPPGTRVLVHDWTIQVLRRSKELNQQSEGLFDPCVPVSRGRMPDIELHSDHVVCRAPVSIDLGGIAKGFAVDVAMEELRRHGCPAGMVNAGGDLRVFGQSPRIVHVRDQNDEAFPITLQNMALAVSGPSGDGAPSGHRGYYEGIRGKPVSGRLVAVTAASAVIADGLCKCAMLCAPSALAKILEAYKAHLVTPRRDS
jgi:thiamine biosynthesis lipoprotein